MKVPHQSGLIAYIFYNAPILIKYIKSSIIVNKFNCFVFLFGSKNLEIVF